MEKIYKLTQLLRRINAGEDLQKVTREAKNFLAGIGPRQLALAEHFLLQCGYSVADLWRLCAAHAEILGDRSAKLKAELGPNHIIQQILAEHAVMRCFLAELDDVNNAIQRADYCSSESTELRRLVHITGHLLACDEHKEREDQVIFIELERHGLYGPAEIVKTEHLVLDMCMCRLVELIRSLEGTEFSRLKEELDQVVKDLVPTMREHLFKEENLLFPLALELIDDPITWERMKGLCDEIGYCGLHSVW